MSLLALLHRLAAWGDQARSELIRIPKYFTNETNARGVTSTVMHRRGSMEFLFSRNEHTAAFCELQGEQRSVDPSHNCRDVAL